MFQQIERSAAQVNSLAYKNTKAQHFPKALTHKLANSQTRKLINSQTHKLINSSTHQLANSLTHQLIN